VPKGTLACRIAFWAISVGEMRAVQTILSRENGDFRILGMVFSPVNTFVKM
jgi:hypothetical protein